MITSLMLYALAVGALVALGALVLDRAAESARLPRRFTWVGALLVLAGLTLAAPWRLEPTAPVIAAVDAPMAPALVPTMATVEQAWSTRALDALQSSVARTVESIATRVSPTFDRTLGVVWLVASAALLTLLVLVLRRLDRQRRGWPRAHLLGTTVRVGDAEGPAVYGLLAPDIVIPRALLACDTQAQALVLAHEDEHRRAYDPLLLAAATALVALLPWHPVAWWCLARLRLATELDCDARVLRRGVSPRRYGDVLLSLASSLPVGPRAAHALALFDAPRHLERRLLAMTSPVTRRSPLAVAGFALLGTVLIAAACNTDVPTAAEVRDADVAAVTKTLGLPTGANAIAYFVDGVQRSEAEAQAVRAEQIASIEVRRETGGQGANEVRIVTRAAAGATGDADVEEEVELVEERVVSGTAGVLRRATSDTAEFVVRGDTLMLWRDSTGGRVVLRGDSVQLRTDSLRTRLSASGNAVARVRLMTDGTAGDSVIEVGGRRPYVVSSRADSGTYVVVRGGRDSAGGVQPLVIVDGVISTVPNPLQNLVPTQIESIEVVKGEAARRLYGERGANGVIMVRTKQ
ncbi:MAG TPA: M56 family metallopeptidase [Gemmatimonadaceae bacterium]|nr:M56 family metallopeptidase [Gemmatimonadaceae bacterium]